MTAEERAAERFDVDAVIFVEAGRRNSPTDTGDIVICNSLDLSETGLQIVLDQTIEKGRIVRICLDIHNRELVFVVAKVQWHKGKSGDVRHGLMLMNTEESDLPAWKQAVEALTEMAV